MSSSQEGSPKIERVSAVIPAYNEEMYIAEVLEPLRQVKYIERITVVDDGSNDGTAEVVRYFCSQDPRVRLLRLPDNRGKGGALKAGAEASPSDLVLFLDADLVGMNPENILALIEPVRSGCCAMSLGIFTGGRLSTDLTQHISPFLNGQRCLRWSLFRSTPGMDSSRSAAEVALSLHARRCGYRVSKVPLYGVTHVMKQEKRPWLQGRRAHARMFGEIARYLVKHINHRKSYKAASERRWR